VGDQATGKTGMPVSSGLQVPVEPGHFRAMTRHVWRNSHDIFISKFPSIAPAEISNSLRDRFALWKLINKEMPS
jgi:hypothetical protein